MLLHCTQRLNFNECFDDMREAVKYAKQVNRAADTVAEGCAEILQGRLRNVSAYELRKLKRELQQFDAKSGKWKS